MHRREGCLVEEDSLHTPPLSDENSCVRKSSKPTAAYSDAYGQSILRLQWTIIPHNGRLGRGRICVELRDNCTVSSSNNAEKELPCTARAALKRNPSLYNNHR